MTSELVGSVVEDGLEGVSGVALEETKTKRRKETVVSYEILVMFFFIPLEMGRMKIIQKTNTQILNNQVFLWSLLSWAS